MSDATNPAARRRRKVTTPEPEPQVRIWRARRAVYETSERVIPAGGLFAATDDDPRVRGGLAELIEQRPSIEQQAALDALR